jgi:hypothetical protein
VRDKLVTRRFRRRRVSGEKLILTGVLEYGIKGTTESVTVMWGGKVRHQEEGNQLTVWRVTLGCVWWILSRYRKCKALVPKTMKLMKMSCSVLQLHMLTGCARRFRTQM